MCSVPVGHIGLDSRTRVVQSFANRNLTRSRQAPRTGEHIDDRHESRYSLEERVSRLCVRSVVSFQWLCWLASLAVSQFVVMAHYVSMVSFNMVMSSSSVSQSRRRLGIAAKRAAGDC